MMKNGNLDRAGRKVQHFYKREWCGYLTPSEALAILDDGAQPTNNTLYQREHLLEKKKKGDCRPQWFYFQPSKAQMERWA
jgi:hypothetical protein